VQLLHLVKFDVSSLYLCEMSFYSGKKSDGGMQSVVSATTLRPLHCVWAKCRGFPWYPGMVGCICYVLHICKYTF